MSACFGSTYTKIGDIHNEMNLVIISPVINTSYRYFSIYNTGSFM